MFLSFFPTKPTLVTMERSNLTVVFDLPERVNVITQPRRCMVYQLYALNKNVRWQRRVLPPGESRLVCAVRPI